MLPAEIGTQGLVPYSQAGQEKVPWRWNGGVKNKKILTKFREEESGKAKTLGHLCLLQSSVHFSHVTSLTTPHHLPFRLWWKSTEEDKGSCHHLQGPPWPGPPVGWPPLAGGGTPGPAHLIPSTWWPTSGKAVLAFLVSKKRMTTRAYLLPWFLGVSTECVWERVF